MSLSEKPAAGDYVGAGIGTPTMAGTTLPNTRPCRRCGTACGAVYCGPVCEARDFAAWAQGVFAPVALELLAQRYHLAGRAALDELERRVEGLEASGELHVFRGRDGRVRAVGTPHGPGIARD